MIKKYLFTFSVLCILLFTYCSTEKDLGTYTPPGGSTDKPSDCSETDFTLLPKNHIPDSDLYIEGEILQNQSANPKFMLSKRRFQGIPSIGKDRFGNLYAAWIAATNCTGECNENYLTVSLSKDNGVSWSHDKLIFSVNPQDSTRLKDPNFFNDKFGNLYIYWGKHVQKKNVATKEWAITWYSKLTLSTDESSICYSAPRRIAEGIMINKPVYSNFSDQILFPIARWYEAGADPKLCQAFIYKANYGPDNLNNFTNAGFIPLDAPLRGIYEHMIVQLKDNTYLGMVRTGDGIYYSKSADGNIWTNGKKFVDAGATTSARFYLGKLKSGRLILIYNNAKTRTNMTVCLSDDDGVTWPYKMLVDNSADGFFGVSYPDMIETEPGTLNIVYDYLRAPAGTINFVQINEDDIINRNQSGVFRTKISTLK